MIVSYYYIKMDMNMKDKDSKLKCCECEETLTEKEYDEFHNEIGEQICNDCWKKIRDKKK
jgi:hypothetical protein